MTINTTNGAYVVSYEKEAALIQWLEQNAVKVGQHPSMVREQTACGTSQAVYLITEDIGKEF
jgi:hypothetical protein